MWRRHLREADRSRAVVIGMGTNIGSPGQRRCILLKAIHNIESFGAGHILAVSSLYETPPWGNVNQDAFTNGVFAVHTTLEPLALLKHLKFIERHLGRKPRQRWGPREIDLDILLYKNLSVTTRNLIIPHKHMAERQFVMVPLRELLCANKNHHFIARL